MKQWVVETQFVFDRHAATDVSVAYTILVPQRQARIERAGQEGTTRHDQRGDLCAGVFGAAEKRRDDQQTKKPPNLGCAIVTVVAGAVVLYRSRTSASPG